LAMIICRQGNADAKTDEGQAREEIQAFANDGFALSQSPMNPEKSATAPKISTVCT